MRKMKYLSASLIFIIIVYISLPLDSFSSFESYSTKTSYAQFVFNTAARVITAKQMENSGARPKHSFEKELKLIFNDLRHTLLVGYLKDVTYVRCVEDLMYFLQNLGTSSDWASRMIDSYGKPESGLLRGKVKWLGDYDECLGVHAPYDETYHQGNFRGQYCSLKVTVHIANLTVPVILGICIPDSCHSSALKLEETIKMNTKIPSSNIQEQSGPVIQEIKLLCQPTSRELTSEAMLVMCLIYLVVLLTIIGSSITLFEHFVKPPYKSHGSDTDIETESDKVDQERLLLQDDRDDYTSIKTGFKDMEKKKFQTNLYLNLHPVTDTTTAILARIEKCKAFFNAFCVFTNGAKLLDTNYSEKHLQCLHGIRFLSLCWIFICSTFAFGINAIKNVADLLPFLDTWYAQIVLNGIFSVDSFFLLSGFVVGNIFFNHSSQTKGKIKWIYVYIHRYLRLTPVYMMVLLFYATLYSYLGSGPNWVNFDTDPACGKNWWWNLLYINNFQRSTEQCFGWSWYLASDLQFFVISPIILVPLLRRPKMGYSLLAVFFFITSVANIVVTYYLDLTAGFEKVITFDDLQKIFAKSLDSLDYMHKRPYTRIAPYLVGIFLAYYLYRRKLSGCGKNNLVTLSFGWMISTIVSLLCVFGLYRQKLSLVESCFYNAFSHAGFSLSLAWIIYVCVTGQGGFVNSFLSCKFFIPLSRLTFCVYLVHPIILMAYYGSQKSLIHFSNITMIVLLLGFLLLSYSVALVTSLLFEAPVIRLGKFLRSNTRKDTLY